MLLDKLINRYWMFKQISPLVDINLHFCYILYEIIRSRILRAPTDEEFIKNHLVEDDYFAYYSKEGVRFRSWNVGNFHDMSFNCVLGFDKYLNLVITYNVSRRTFNYILDCKNSLIDRNNITRMIFDKYHKEIIIL